jgi:beta-N-acetylhexosaminidase
MEVQHLNDETRESAWTIDTLHKMTLEEKVGQMLQVRYYADYADLEDPNYKKVREQVQKYHIGSVVFGMHFNKLGPIRSTALEAARISNQLQRDSKIPLLFAADLERGTASRLLGVPSAPWPMAWGAIGDVLVVERFGLLTAVQARAVGIHWALAPVADVNSNPANPVINVRSFGESPDQVSLLISAFIRGAHKGGLLVTAKHFPGNGDTSIDAHRSLASIDGDMAHLQKIELPPFEAAIASHVDSIMLTHARVPSLEPDPDKITTTSAKIVTELLKEQLKFKGVIVTDALEMRGITKLYDPASGSPTARAALDAVKAGCDVIMIPTDLDGAFHEILNAVKNGGITESRIDESVRKILEMKVAVGLDKDRFVDLSEVQGLTSRPEDMAFAQEIADKAVTLVRDDAKLLPLVKQQFPGKDESANEGSIAIILLAEALEETNGVIFEKEINARLPNAKVFRFDGRFSGSMTSEIENAARTSDQIVLATYVVHGAARQVNFNGKQFSYFGLNGMAGRLFGEIVNNYPHKTAVIALGSPYLITSFPQIETYICTYAMTSSSEVSAVRALFGEVQNHAKLPVTLPGVAPLGFSLPWPSPLKAERPTLQAKP